MAQMPLPSMGEEVMFGSPTKAQASNQVEGNGLADLLDNSDDGVIVTGVEQSFDFNPPEAVSSHAAATGFEDEFTDTVVIKEEQKQV